MANRLFDQANETKIKKLILPMLSVALYVLPVDEMDLKREILFKLATKLKNTDKKSDALKYAEECYLIHGEPNYKVKN